MKRTVKELTAELKVKRSTLGVRLFDAGIQPSGYMLRDHRLVAFYEDSTLERVRDLMKRKPIRKILGRPPKTSEKA